MQVSGASFLRVSSALSFFLLSSQPFAKVTRYQWSSISALKMSVIMVALSCECVFQLTLTLQHSGVTSLPSLSQYFSPTAAATSLIYCQVCLCPACSSVFQHTVLAAVHEPQDSLESMAFIICHKSVIQQFLRTKCRTFLYTDAYIRTNGTTLTKAN